MRERGTISHTTLANEKGHSIPQPIRMEEQHPNQSEWRLKTTANQKREQPALSRLGVDGEELEKSKSRKVVTFPSARGIAMSPSLALFFAFTTFWNDLICRFSVLCLPREQVTLLSWTCVHHVQQAYSRRLIMTAE